MMQQKRTRSSKPKLFQCTGFGNCNMVFTRSEHLARHSRKHTGEKPFVCIVPLCTKAFSRFDNMMQHTQTHRNNNNYNIITTMPNKYEQGRDTRSSMRQQEQDKVIKQMSCEHYNKNNNNNNLFIHTKHNNDNTSSGLISPISLSSLSPKYSHYQQPHSNTSSEDEDDEQEQPITPIVKRRRLSVADLCNPPIQLTKDEYEALEGFGRFRHSPSVFVNSLRDLAHIDH